MSERLEDSDLGPMVAAYRDAKSRRDVLVKEAGELAERLGRLAHGLSEHPGRVVIGDAEQRIENPGEWDIVPGHPLPSIEHLIALTSDIRAVGARVEELRDRLILMGHAELVEQPDGFFH